MTIKPISRTLSYLDINGEERRVLEADLASQAAPIVILGDPGMGKTHLMTALGAVAGHRFVTARKFLREANPAPLAASGGILVIDALDEMAAASELDPINQVMTQLAAAGHPPFVLSCRSAEWQGAIGKSDITEEYGREPLVLTLNPIEEAEAVAFAAQRLGEDKAAVLIASLSARSLQHMYGNPLILMLACKVVEAEGRLPDTSFELYNKACDLLRKETNEKHATSRLANLTASGFLDSAGAACAALLLTGSDALSLEPPGLLGVGDLHVAEVEALPCGADIRAVLKSKLFNRLADGDRFAPLHKVLAEFLAARWIATLSPSVSRTRLFALLAPDGGPPSSLRGLHAWLSAFNDSLARRVLEADPYGVLRYADVMKLSDSNVRLLLDALEKLSREDPHFRSTDWHQQVAPGLARGALTADLERRIGDPATEFQFRMLLLQAIEGQPVAVSMAGTLEHLLLEKDDGVYYFAERSAAADALIAAKDLSPNWPALVHALQVRTGGDSRRLAIEIMTDVGPAAFSARQVAEAALSYLNLLPGSPVLNERANTIGVLHFLGRALPAEMIGDVLDAMVEIRPEPSRLKDWEVRWGLAELVDVLVERIVTEQRPDPARLLSWLRLSREDGYNRGSREGVIKALTAADALRRAIQYEALIVSRSADTLWERSWRAVQACEGLRQTPDDIVWLIGEADFNISDPEAFAMLTDLVRLGRSPKGLAPAVVRAAQPYAAGNTEFAAFLSEVRKNRMPDWQREQRARERRREKAKQASFEGQRAELDGQRAELSAGDLAAVYKAAEVYLGRYSDIDNTRSPADRVREWLGSDLGDIALTGFESALHRQDLPTAAAVADSYAESRRWSFVLPMLAGMTERAQSGRNFTDLPEDVVIATRIALLREHVGEATGGAVLEKALIAWFADRPASTERFIRLMIEPQLRRGGPHVSGLYQLVRGDQPLVTTLVPEWLEAFPDMDRSAEFELVGHLLHRGEYDRVAQAAERRRTAGYRDNDHARSWLAIGFLIDFEAHRAALDLVATDPTFLGHLRTWRGEARREGGKAPPLSLEALTWLFETFRSLFPATYRSSSSGRNEARSTAIDSTEFMLGVMREIAAKLSDDALAIMDRLRAAPEDGYTDDIRSARTQQIIARREKDFSPASLDQLQSVASSGPPVSVTDLQAVALDTLAAVQARIRGDDLESVSLFYDAGTPLDENGCRDRLGVLLRGLLPTGVDITPERAAPGHTRADLVFTLGSLHLPVEAKGQWHPELWTAAENQLDARYTRDWRAEGAGIYLVFWFGDKAPANRRLKGPPRGMARPKTPAVLEEALRARVPEHRRGSIAVVVLDLSFPPKKGEN